MKNNPFDSSAEKVSVTSAQSGQALVEFVILLIIFMALVAGQIYASRLLLFDYWAQQEARFAAYEQMEAPAAAGRQPFNELNNGAQFRRPSLVSGLAVTRETADEEDMRDLMLSKNDSILRRFKGPYGDKYQDPAADRSYYAARERSRFSLIEPAYARQNIAGSGSALDLQILPKNLPLFEDQRMPHTTLDDNIQNLLETAEIGEQICSVAAQKFSMHGYRGAAAMFAASGCAPSVNRGFAVHLTQTADVRELTREYSDRLEWGDHPDQALQESLRQIVARGYYSFFDQTIRNSASQAQTSAAVNDHDSEVQSAIDNDQQFSQLLSENRYLGSAIVENMISVAIMTIRNLPNAGQSAQAEKTVREMLNSIVHADGKATLAGTGYWLDQDYLPFPTLALVPMYGGILNAAMENVLSKDNDLEDPLIYQSHKETVVRYVAGNGLFPAAVRRFNTSGRRFTSRHYLVTQSWEIPRRTAADGAYRLLGTENDDYNSGNSDEAALKRRVIGLWLIPSNPVALLTPIVDLVDQTGTVGNLFNNNIALEGFSEGIELLSGAAKDFICDNPLNDVMGWLEALPGFNASAFTLPACPAVRPAAYPFTKEISGDRTTGLDRNFQDFVDEQKDANPIANPEYHEDSDTASSGGGQEKQGSKVCGWD